MNILKHKLNKNIFKEFLFDNNASIDRKKLLKFSSIILFTTANLLVSDSNAFSVAHTSSTGHSDCGSRHANGGSAHGSGVLDASLHCSVGNEITARATDHVSSHDSNDWHNSGDHSNFTTHGNNTYPYRDGSQFIARHAHAYATVTCYVDSA